MPKSPKPASVPPGELPPVMKFSNDEVNGIILKNVETIIGNTNYTQEKAQTWAKDILAACLDQLQKLTKPYKYIVNCSIIQKDSGGLYNASSCYWDNTRDNMCTVRWDNRFLHCIVTVYGIAVN
ncbi:unnamed protein product [Calicophoron daubneyi]|uniref:Dynein light chain Tctex-type 1 n=1 Tax=Calicophoron daubneyi TaxID=300641 RepID=A0AAV2TLX0_CALDB